MPGGPTCLSLSNSVIVISFMGFPDGSAGKESACNARNTADVGSIPGSGRSPGDGNGNHSSILAWKIPWTEGPGELQSNWSQRVRYNWVTKHTHAFFYVGSSVSMLFLLKLKPSLS